MTQPTPDPHQLPRVLGWFDAMMIVVGSIIGSGVFLKASVVAGALQSFWPILAVWIVVGLVTLCGSLALAELAAMLPHAGGPYVYLREAYGRLPAFLWGWTEFWIVRTGSLGALACATVIYFDKWLVALKAEGLLPAALESLAPLSHAVQAGLAIGLVLLISAVNIGSTRWAAWVQNVTSVAKVGFLAFLIAAPLLLGKASLANASPALPTDWSATFWRAVGVAVIAVLWPYDGWINIGPVAEEIREPQRNVPRALWVGMLVVILVYVGANASYHLVLPMQAVQTSSAVAADVSAVLLGPTGVWLAAVGVMCSTFGALNSNLLAGPRIYFAMARDGLFPAAIRQVHATLRTPANAIVAQAVWSVALVLLGYYGAGRLAAALNAGVARLAGWIGASQPPQMPVPSTPADAFDFLTDFVIFGGSIFYALAVGAVFVLRFRRPELERPYRTWGYPVTPLVYLLFFAAALASMLIDKWLQSLLGAALIAAGVAAYAAMTRGQRQPGP